MVFFPCCLSVRSLFLSPSPSFSSASETFRLSALSAPGGESGRRRRYTASLIQQVPWMNEMTNVLFSESHSAEGKKKKPCVVHPPPAPLRLQRSEGCGRRF